MGNHRWEMGHHGCTEKGSLWNCLECMGRHGWEMGHHGCTKKGSSRNYQECMGHSVMHEKWVIMDLQCIKAQQHGSRWY
jgi:hypothetical protein